MHYNNNMLGCCFCTFYSARNDVFYFFENTDNQHHYYCTKIIPFTGKERDEETSYSYFGARYYDSDLSGLFLSVDPMADKYPSISPYAYCAWNPVKLVDPDGRDVWEIDKKGNIKWKEHSDDIVLYSVDDNGKRGNKVEISDQKILKQFTNVY